MKTQKLKVKQASRLEVTAILTKALDKFDRATVGELQSALCTLAESFISVTAECPDEQTQFGLAMELLCLTLDSAAGSPSLQENLPLIEDISPLTGSTN